MTEIGNTMKAFTELPNVKIVRQLNEIINVDKLFDSVDNIGWKDGSIFNCSKNTIILFDCEDYNSAFLHEYFLNEHRNGDVPAGVDVVYVESNDVAKKFIERYHKDVHNLPVRGKNPDGTPAFGEKFEIFIIAIIDGEVFTKSDDFDFINHNTITDLLDIYKSDV